MITLKNNTLRVEIAEPGEHPNDGVRFDRAGFVMDVILNNERHFCANEPKNLSHPTSGGRGFCSEFKMDVSAEAEIGQPFPKFGVGLITKEDNERYIFHKNYKEIKHFPVSYTANDTEAVFDTEAVECMGYAMRAHKRVSIDGDTLLMEHTVENVGSKELNIEEYCHNFISIDGMAISPDYKVQMPSLRDMSGEHFKGHNYGSNLVGDGHGFTFIRAELPVSLVDFDLTGMDPKPPFKWSVEHLGAKARIEAEDSYVPCGIAVWSVDHILSPENFNKIVLKPGESFSWSRKLKFIDLMK